MPSPVTSRSNSTAEIESQLTVADVAELTGTSIPTVRRWIARGELRAYRYGRRTLRIDPADVRRMRREVNPATYTAVSGGETA